MSYSQNDLDKAAIFVTSKLDVDDLLSITYGSILEKLQQQTPEKLEETFDMYKEVYNYDPNKKT